MSDSLTASKKSSSPSASASSASSGPVVHPLDPADSFVHIEDSSNPPTSPQSTTKKKATKDPRTSSLEDGWDFVEEIDDSPPKKPSPLAAKTSDSKKQKGALDKSASKSLSSSKPSRGASSLPPPAAHVTSRQERATMAHVTGSPPDEVILQRSRQGTNRSAKRPSAELASNSGFKHRIYCTLYNLYHAQPSEGPALSTTPIFMMGAVITPHSDTPNSSPPYALNSSSSGISIKESKGKQKSGESKRTKDDFLEMCRTLSFFSYRKDFARLDGYQVTSDVGWGCMLRTGQMLLASALQRLYEPMVGGRPIYGGNVYDRSKMRVLAGQELITPSNAPIIARHILSWFRDDPDLERYPYSIHNLVRTSRIQNATSNGQTALVAETGVAPSWFSPTKLSRVLRFLVRMHAPDHLTMYVPPDGVLYVDEIVALCTDPQTSTISPMPSCAHQDRTFLWWKRYSANGPSVSRSPTLPHYDGSEDEELRDSSGSIDTEHIEDDALYQRALAESMAQYEAEAPGSELSSPSSAGGMITSIPPPPSSSTTTTTTSSSSNSSSSRHARNPSDGQLGQLGQIPNGSVVPTSLETSALLEWSTRDWAMDSASAPPASHVIARPPPEVVMELRPASLAVPRSKPSKLESPRDYTDGIPIDQRRSSDASNDGAQPSSLSENGKFFPRPSTESTNSIDASSAWVHLPIIRSDFGVIGSSGSSTGEDPLDDYFVSPGMSSAPLNLSSWVENHEKLTGVVKPSKALKKQLQQQAQQANLLQPTSNLSPRPSSVTVAAYSSNSASLVTATPSSIMSTSPLATSPGTQHTLDMSYAAPLSPSSKVPSPYSSIGTDQFKALGNDDSKSGGSISPGRTRTLEDSVFSFIPPSAPNPTTAGIPNSAPADSEKFPQARMGYSLNSATVNPTKNPSIVPSAPTDTWRPLLLLVPSRLGVSKVNPAYIEHLKLCLSSASSVGIVGGKPNKSLYFFAFQDDYVFYLDPHYVHSATKPVDSHGNVHDSYKVRFPQKMKLLDLDPSLALGFFIRTRADFEAFCQTHHSFAVQAQDDTSAEPIFTILASAPDYLQR